MVSRKKRANAKNLAEESRREEKVCETEVEQTDKDQCDEETPDQFYDSNEELRFENESIEYEDNPQVSLSIIYNQLKLYRSELLTKIDIVKDDIVQQLKSENQALLEKITSLESNLQSKEKEISEIKAELNASKKEFVKVERDVIDLQQYIRRNNIEICNIPESENESIKDLEKKVVQISKAVGLNVTTNQIEACHRLATNQNGPRKVIVRFTNRKNCEILLRSSKLFKEKTTQEKAGLSSKIFINNNLCSYNKFLWGKAKCLKQNKLIHKFWCFNGTINVLLTDNVGDHAHKIKHINDLIDLKPDNDIWKAHLTK